MKISDLSRATGVDVETIRYYEKAGLLPAPAREANGYRSYGGPHLERLAFVRHCRALDMPLADVKRLLDFVGGVRDERGDIDALIAAQLLRVRARLKSLRAMERQLTALRDSCDADHATHECGILHELVAAAHGEACACHAEDPVRMNLPRGVWASLLAALLFGAGTPLAKLLLAQAGPWLLAALLYLGSGIGLALMRRMRPAPPVRLAAGEVKWLAGAVLAGGVAGPVLLMLGLAAMPASSASLLLNAEAVFTALLAWFVFKENVNRSRCAGHVRHRRRRAAARLAGQMSWPGWQPALFVVAACFAWGLDNNLTRKVSLGDASWIAMVKGLAAGTTNLVLAFCPGCFVAGAACGAGRGAGRLRQLRRQPGAFHRGAARTGHGAHGRVFFRGAVFRRTACHRAIGRARHGAHCSLPAC